MKKAIFLNDAVKLLENHLNNVLNDSPSVSEFTKSVYSMASQHCIVVLKTMPGADVVPVHHGRWSQTGYDHGIKVCECSVCKKRAYGSTKFCSNCGALMDKDGDAYDCN